MGRETCHGRERKVNVLVGAVTGSTGTQRRGANDFLLLLLLLLRDTDLLYTMNILGILFEPPS